MASRERKRPEFSESSGRLRSQSHRASLLDNRAGAWITYGFWKSMNPGAHELEYP